MRTLRLRLAATTALLALAAPELALAQDPGGAAPVPTQGGGQSVKDAPDIVVSAPRLEVKARLRQEDAPNIIEVQSAETILKYPDFNAAEALGRIPGVSLSSDTGEGRFVNIRGIDANLNGATYGGVVLLNTNPGGTYAGGGGRAVEFDTVPTGAIDGIVVTKTRLPDQEGEGLGGSVELTPRSAAHVNAPFVDGILGWGYEPLHDHTGPFDAELAVGARFGFGDKGLLLGDAGTPRVGFISNPTPFSFVLFGSRRDDRRAIDDLEESYIDASVPPTNKQVSQYDLRRYDYHRRRYALGGEFDFTPNDDHAYYVRASYFGYIEAVHKNFLLLSGLDGGTNADGAVDVNPADPKGWLTTTLPKVTLTDEQESHRNGVYVVGGHDRWGPALLDYRAAYSRSTFAVGHNFGAQFYGPSGVPIAYDNIANPEYPIFQFTTDATHPTAFNPNDPTQYNLKKLSANGEFDTDEEFSYAADLLLDTHMLGDSDQLKFGGEIRLRNKVQDPTTISGITVPALNLSQASGPANTYYDGRYPNGPFINRYAIRNIFSSEASQLTETTNLDGYFRDRENIYAGYGQYSVTFDKLNVLAGVRVEGTAARYDAYEDNGIVAPFLVGRNENYVNAFPTVQARYRILPNLEARAIFSTGISRPGFEQNTANTVIDSVSNPGVTSVTEGNPNLKPTTGDMFDFDVEYFLPNAGIVEIGVFDKEFSNYIVPRVMNNIPNSPLAQGNPLTDITTFENISNAYARGFEFAYQQKFTFLPGPLSGLGFEGNITLVDSRILEYDAATSASGTNQYGPLPGTSKNTWNAAAYYEKYGLQLRLAAQYVSHSLFALGGDRSLDNNQDSRLTMDFTSSYQVDPHFQLYFYAKNLLNTPLRYYEGESSRPIQREFYDATFEAGVRFHF